MYIYIYWYPLPYFQVVILWYIYIWTSMLGCLLCLVAGCFFYIPGVVSQYFRNSSWCMGRLWESLGVHLGFNQKHPGGFGSYRRTDFQPAVQFLVGRHLEINHCLWFLVWLEMGQTVNPTLAIVYTMWGLPVMFVVYEPHESYSCLCIKNHGFWSYVHQFSYRKRGPHIAIICNYSTC